MTVTGSLTQKQLKIKGWRKFQHYKHRDPPWIRLYRSLLNDRQWHNLSGDDAKALVMIWLIVSETEGELPKNEDLAFRLRLPEKQISKLLERLSHWLEHDASGALADCYQDAPPETETEAETEAETEYIVSSQPSVAECDKEFEEFWEEYPDREGSANKGGARKKFRVVRSKGISLEDLLNGARGYSEVVIRDKIEPRFVCMAATWLNQERWGDYTEAVDNVTDLLEFHRQQCMLRKSDG
jgi:hypothetical protein